MLASYGPQALKQDAERAVKLASASAADAKAAAQEVRQQLADVRRQMPREVSPGDSQQDADTKGSPDGDNSTGSAGAELPTLQQLAASRDKLQVCSVACATTVKCES